MPTQQFLRPDFVVTYEAEKLPPLANGTIWQWQRAAEEVVALWKEAGRPALPYTAVAGKVFKAHGMITLSPRPAVQSDG